MVLDGKSGTTLMVETGGSAREEAWREMARSVRAIVLSILLALDCSLAE